MATAGAALPASRAGHGGSGTWAPAETGREQREHRGQREYRPAPAPWSAGAAGGTASPGSRHHRAPPALAPPAIPGTDPPAPPGTGTRGTRGTPGTPGSAASATASLWNGFSEAKRLELERQLMEHTMADPYLMQEKPLELQKHLAAVSERQQSALRRNQSYRREFRRLQEHMDTTGLEMIRKMEAWYGREIKSLLSLQEGSLSAGGDKEEGSSEQNPLMTTRAMGFVPGGWWEPALQTRRGLKVPQAGGRAGMGTEAAVPREWFHPDTAFLGCPTPAVSATGGLGTQQEPCQPPFPEGCGAQSRSSAAGETEGSLEGAHGDLAASQEGSEQLLSSAPDPTPATPEEGQLQGGVPGSKSVLSDWWAGPEESSAELLVSSSAEEGVTPSTASAQQGRDGDAQAGEGSPLPPLSPTLAQQEPWDSSAPHRDTEVLQSHLSHHSLVLEQHRAQAPEGAAEISDDLLALEAQDSQALPMLREALPGERGDGSPVQGEESSCSLPSIPTDGEGEQAERAARLTGTGEPGGDMDDDSSKASDGREAPLETSSSSDGIVLPFSRTETRKEKVTAIKSKAFWGESDDSSSELEAALRPQTHSAQSDDFDDFYA
ncbi:centrosomal protein kizuna isoform X2 [Pseudopipra pipra]|uniref:centrosomal protein kizuna isoform X2 n=1 Tax=Pseudopipra pipra TaxID=415032 RepID=UPI003138BDEE